MTKLEALEGSVAKWEGICDDERLLHDAKDICSLCVWSGPHCEGCPLDNIGAKCTNAGSLWSIIVRWLHGVSNRYSVTFSTAPGHIQFPCLEFRDLLRKLRDEEKTLQEKK